MKNWKAFLLGLAGTLIVAVSAALGANLGARTPAVPTERRAVYIVSLSRTPEPDGMGYWTITYAIEGQAYALSFEEPARADAFLDYLESVGDIQGAAE